MTVFIDLPRWPAHNTLWSHVVSDTSLDELHHFAARLGVPRRGFDLDHYDLPSERYDDAIAAGAVPASMREIVEALRSSGLRVAARDRPAKKS
ncbi:DUF4031 domain-containing protein [Subtercola sp. PAMC28395]|uniref:DUF4031 domain-containing protein n=1 Tax=Subtercola sp. PAMC28395 TaxID=2846775 RepID=UPI001C0B6F3C|nr:DUF4031 domain-containing protein [Subtercola sp. PAMC28395]QWT22944.1 DUF4031 domain-containing protein [Subtercola sp. PAMC28395]